MLKQRFLPIASALLGLVTAILGGLAEPSPAAVPPDKPSGHGVVHPRYIYISQHGSGARRGSGCADARSVAWLDSPSSWRPAGGPIGAGTVVNLCGHVSSPITVHGSGAPGKPVTIVFRPGARISLPACPESGCLNTEGNRYLTVNGGRNGVIESSANGTTRAERFPNATGLVAIGCTGCVIEHLTIRDMYVHTSLTDTAPVGDHGLAFSGRDLTIRDNVLHDVQWALVAQWRNGDGNVRIFGNRIYRIDHGFASTAGFDGGAIGPIFFDRNQVYDYANWDTARDVYHHDGIHCYTWGGGEAHYAGFYIYDNRFGGLTGADMTAQIFIDGPSSGDPCADRTSSFWIFNNIATVSQGYGNGIFAITSGVPHVVNNTLISTGPSVSGGAAYTSGDSISGEQFLNNVVSSANELMNVDTSQVAFAAGSPNYNLYADGGDNAFVCRHTFFTFQQFPRWRTCVGADSHSRVAPTARLRSGGQPTPRSPAIHAGANLSALCTGSLKPLCYSLDGHPRPRRGSWNAGAY